MIPIKLYESVTDKCFDLYNDDTIELKKEDFENRDYHLGRDALHYQHCWFNGITIKNFEDIDFPTILIHFYCCEIKNIRVLNIKSENINITFTNCIIDFAWIQSENLKNVSFVNCISRSKIDLVNIKSVNVLLNENELQLEEQRQVTFTSGIQSRLRTRSKTLNEALETEQVFKFTDCDSVWFLTQEFDQSSPEILRSIKNDGAREKDGKVITTYALSEEQKKKYSLRIEVNFSDSKLTHNAINIEKSKLKDLEISGNSRGNVLIDDCLIDNLYLDNFSAQKAVFSKIRPFRKSQTNLMQIRNSNMDNVVLDNVDFTEYTTINLFRNRYGSFQMWGCIFPSSGKDFDRFKTYEDIANPIEESYYHYVRYETLLQLKNIMASSGNLHIGHILKEASMNALSKVKLSSWDRRILCLNRISNSHGLSISRPLGWFILVSVLFYTAYLWSLGFLNINYPFEIKLLGFFFEFLDITHNSDFLIHESKLNNCSRILDFLYRLIASYLIYQFIAAFRKYSFKE